MKAVYLNRQLETIVLEANKAFPVILLTGPRQVGKSTMLQHLAEEERTYVSLDDPVVRQAALASPGEFFQIYKPPALIDEVQYAPELFPYIKMIVDQRKETGLFWLTGSQIFQLMDHVEESLAGRVALLNLYSLSQSELAQNFSSSFPPPQDALIDRWEALASENWPSMDQRIFEGGMPRYLLHPGMNRQLFFSSYFQTYLQKDIRDIAHIHNFDLYTRFVRLVALRTGQELNLAALSSELGIDATSVRRWLNMLLLTGVIFTLPAWSANLGKRLIKRPKLYFMDTGFCSYLCGFDQVEELADSPMRGPLFENYVVSEIMKSWAYAGKRPAIYYVRESGGGEIDLLIEDRQKLYPFEIKRSSPGKRAFKHWSLLESKKEAIVYSGLITSSDRLLPAGENRWIIPWQVI